MAFRDGSRPPIQGLGPITDRSMLEGRKIDISRLFRTVCGIGGRHIWFALFLSRWIWYVARWKGGFGG